jgi:hypothetical protein
MHTVAAALTTRKTIDFLLFYVITRKRARLPTGNATSRGETRLLPQCGSLYYDLKKISIEKYPSLNYSRVWI